MIEYPTELLATTLAHMAADAFARAAHGKPAGTVLIERDRGTPLATTVKAAAERLNLPFFRLQATPDLLIEDLDYLNFDPQPSGAMLLIDEPERLSNRTAEKLGRLIDGNVSQVPSLNHMEMSRWFIVLAKGITNEFNIHPDLESKASAKIIMKRGGTYEI